MRFVARYCAGEVAGERLPFSAMETAAVPLHVDHARERELLVRKARFLAWLGLAWHGIEAAIAIVAGLVAGSIALIGFGADSLIEMIAGVILIWRFAGSRADSEHAEHPAHRLIAVTFWLIATYVAIEATRSLAGGEHPEVSWVGIGLAGFTLATMPPLAAAKARVGERLHSSAVQGEGRQTRLCAYLSAALLIGLGANAAFGWWWADPVTALLIAAVAVNEGREAWAGNACDDCC
jgi:divalent metal cation (Fe/Co/Zn/Cd) transporter